MGSNPENNPDLINFKKGSLLYAVLQYGNVAPDGFHLNSGKHRARWTLTVLAMLNLFCPRFSERIKKKCRKKDTSGAHVPTDLSALWVLSIWPCSPNQAFT